MQIQYPAATVYLMQKAHAAGDTAEAVRLLNEIDGRSWRTSGDFSNSSERLPRRSKPTAGPSRGIDNAEPEIPDPEMVWVGGEEVAPSSLRFN
jgi:hypothetical protein